MPEPEQRIPTLQELFDRFKSQKDDLPKLQLYFQLIASGQQPPLLTNNNAQLAAQVMTIVINHILINEEKKDG